MRILFVMGFFLPVPPQRGGASEKSSLALAEWLQGRGHEVTVFSRQWPEFSNEEIREGVHHRRFPGHDHSRHLLANLWQDARWNQRIRAHLMEFDAVISNSVLLPALFPKRQPQPTILQWVARMPKSRQAWLWHRATRILAPSAAVVSAIGRSSPAMADRIRLLPYPIDFSALAKADQTFRQTDGGGPIEIGYIGRIHPEKGLDLLLEATAILAERPHLPAWQLTLTGPHETRDGGGGATYLRSLQTKAEPLSSIVRFHPAIRDSEQLARQYAQTSLFVYPSQAERGEALGVAPLEAMAAGGIPIVSHLTCFRDFVENGKTGLTFDAVQPDSAKRLADQLEFALQNPSWCQQARQEARESARRYDLTCIGETLEAVLTEARSVSSTR